MKSWRKAAVALAALGGLTVAAELGCRFVLGLGSPPLYVADPQLEYSFQPNQELRRFGNRIAINNFGLRGEPLTPTPAAGTRRVLLFGDSLIWGGAQLDQSLIASSLLPALLKGPKPAAGPIEVAAAGTPSWGPANWLAFKRRYGRLGAQQVLLVISSHDAVDWPSFEPLERQADKPTRKPALALQEAFSRYLMRVLPIEKPLPNTPTLPPAEQERRSLAALATLISELRRSGVEPRALQYWDKNETLNARPDPGHAAIAAVLAQAGVPTSQAGPAMVSCARAAGSAPAALFTDEIHPYTPLGQRCLAEAIATALG